MEHKLPTTKGLVMIVVYAVMVLLSTTSFALRVYIRSKLVNRAWEDWAAGIGWLIYVLFCAAAMVGPFYGTGQYADLIPPNKLPIALRQFWIAELTYVAANLAVKSSIALMLLRYTVEEYQKKLVYLVTGVTQVYSAIFLLIFLFQCMPPIFFWTRYQDVVNGRCINPGITVITDYVYLAVTIVFDWTMAVLPWCMVRKLHLDLRTKRMIAVVLSLGSIASIATLIRIPYVVDLGNTKDFLHDNVNLAIWACIETGLCITASSAATLKPLFRKKSSQSRPSGQMTPQLNTLSLTSKGSNSTTSTKPCDAETLEIRHHRQF